MDRSKILSLWLILDIYHASLLTWLKQSHSIKKIIFSIFTYWQRTVREPGPAGLGPLSRKPPRGQENTTPVFTLILIHSTYHPLKKWSGMHILSDTTIVSIGVAGCQFSSDGVTSQVSLGTQWVNR